MQWAGGRRGWGVWRAPSCPRWPMAPLHPFLSSPCAPRQAKESCEFRSGCLGRASPTHHAPAAGWLPCGCGQRAPACPSPLAVGSAAAACQRQGAAAARRAPCHPLSQCRTRSSRRHTWAVQPLGAGRLRGSAHRAAAAACARRSLPCRSMPGCGPETPFKKLMAANRGEIAVRITRAGIELGLETVRVCRGSCRQCRAGQGGRCCLAGAAAGQVRPLRGHLLSVASLPVPSPPLPSHPCLSLRSLPSTARPTACSRTASRPTSRTRRVLGGA